MIITYPTIPSNDDFEILKQGLNGFNEMHTGHLEKETIASFIKNDNQQIVGGVLGEIKWGWLHVHGLWVAPNYQAKGYGTQLLKTLEDYAVEKGIPRFRLETTSFQALPFYQKLGYDIFGELSDLPPGYVSYFLQKRI
ncbi:MULTISPECIES: GNAT family N-acetyltransferase [Vibrio]|uniref:GNAT family N-acetyltransferase n=2 Tax=Vibrio TaxID=662 RepID=A0A7X4LL58_9VIBR|nr:MULTISPECIES: GNAT family N-acetyltransferase [Vibrio]MBF9000560.1 GNAT family N-acetyltransferase [Vibrio nitrifigilis]MZI93914.1 GNAT family N-acetyltransferase [Vibrio eleionomae]